MQFSIKLLFFSPPLLIRQKFIISEMSWSSCFRKFSLFLWKMTWCFWEMGPGIHKWFISARFTVFIWPIHRLYIVDRHENYTQITGVTRHERGGPGHTARWQMGWKPPSSISLSQAWPVMGMLAWGSKGIGTFSISVCRWGQSFGT